MTLAVQFVFDPATTDIFDADALANLTLTAANDLSPGAALGRIYGLEGTQTRISGVELVDDAGGAFLITGDFLRIGTLTPLPGDHVITLRVTDSLGTVLEQSVTITVPDTVPVIPGSAEDDAQTSSATHAVYLSSAGNDTITADFSRQQEIRYSGDRADYLIELVSPAVSGGGYGDPVTPEVWQVTDLRAGGPDGVDMVIGTGPRFGFADGELTAAMLAGQDRLTVDGLLLDRHVMLEENTAIGTVLGHVGMTGTDSFEITSYEVRAVTRGFDLQIRNDLFALAADGTLSLTGAINSEEFGNFGIFVTYMDGGVLRSEVLHVDVGDLRSPRPRPRLS